METTTQTTKPALARLTVERADAPLGVGTPAPAFGWELSGTSGQVAYELTVNDGRNQLWSTGRVEGGVTVDILYQGPRLESDHAYQWSVSVEFGSGESCRESSTFETGLLNAEAWKARWVVPDQLRTYLETYTIEQILDGRAVPDLPAEERLRPPVQVRQELTLRENVARARLYATSHGIYTAHVNGLLAGDQVLAPGFDSYPSRLSTQVYDVTAMVRPGSNVIGMTVADGWYAGRIGMKGSSAPFGDELAIIWQLSVEYHDGTRDIIGSGDRQPLGHRGGWDYADLFIGERFDAPRSYPRVVQLQLRPRWLEPRRRHGPARRTPRPIQR